MKATIGGVQAMQYALIQQTHSTVSVKAGISEMESSAQVGYYVSLHTIPSPQACFMSLFHFHSFCMKLFKLF